MRQLGERFLGISSHLPDVGEDYGYLLQDIFERVKSLLLGEHAASYESWVDAGDTASCGHIFERGELVFQCPVCAVDETCVLCSHCFDKRQHEGHKYRYYPSRGEGGSCDCGETESWKRPLTCVLHKSSPDPTVHGALFNDDGIRNVRENWLRLTRHAYDLIKYSSIIGEELSEGEVVLLLVNDEIHSFGEVIAAVSQAIRVDSSLAANVAQIVDLRGCAPIMYFKTFPPEDGSTYAKAYKHALEVLKPTGLRLEVIPADGFTKTLSALGMLMAMEQILRDIPSLRKMFIPDLISWKPEIASEDETFARQFFLHEHGLPKQTRKVMQSIFTLGLPFPEVKEHLLYCFETTLDHLLSKLPEDKEAGGLSMLHFAVQIFTVPSIAQKGCRDGLHRALCRRLFCNKLEEDELSLVQQLEWTRTITQMIQYLCNDESVRRERLVCQDVKFLQDLLQGLLPFHSEYLKVRMDDMHVEYEDQEFIKELNLMVILLVWLAELVNGYSAEEDLLLALPLVCNFISANLDRMDIFGANAKVFNFLQPVIWLLGFMLSRLYLLQGPRFTPFKVPPEVALYVTRLTAIIGEMKEGKWVRNGLEIACMHQFVFSGPTTGQIHLYYTIVLSSMMNPITAEGIPLNAELYHMVLGHKYIEVNGSNQLLWHHPWFFCMVLGGILAYDKTEFIRRSIVQALALGPASYSVITDLVPRWMEDESEFDQILNEVAEVSQTDSLEGSTKYVLKRSQAHLFNPYCWFYDDKSREQALENMSQRYGITKYNILRHPPPAIDPYRRLFHGIGSSKWIVSFANMFVNADLDGNDEDTLLLSAVLKKFVPEFEIKVEGVEGLRNLKSKIELAILKKSDLECIREALESLVVGFKDIEFDERTSRSSSADADDLRRRGEERKRKILLAIQQDQTKFSSAHAAELEEQLVALSPSEMAYELVESGTCVYCQEPAIDLTRTFGVLAALEPLRLCEVDETSRYRRADATLVSCFHVMHANCYFEDVFETKKCPLCRSFANILLPVACAVGSRIFPQDTIKAALSLRPAELQHMEDGWKEWLVSRLDAFDPKPESIPMDESSEALYKHISRDQNLYELFEQNCRQAIGLRGCPEYANVCRLGRLLKSYMLCSPKKKDEFLEALDFRRDSTATPGIFGVLLSALLNFFSPLHMKDEWVPWLIYFVRLVIMGGDRSGNSDLAAVIRYLLCIWYEDETWDCLSIQELLGLDDRSKDLYVSPASASLRATLFPSNSTSWISLPEEFSEFFTGSKLPRHCPECEEIAKYRTSWLICLNCGEHCCPSNQCSLNYLGHFGKYYERPLVS